MGPGLNKDDVRSLRKLLKAINSDAVELFYIALPRSDTLDCSFSANSSDTVGSQSGVLTRSFSVGDLRISALQSGVLDRSLSMSDLDTVCAHLGVLARSPSITALLAEDLREYVVLDEQYHLMSVSQRQIR